MCSSEDEFIFVNLASLVINKQMLLQILVFDVKEVCFSDSNENSTILGAKNFVNVIIKVIAFAQHSS